MQNSNSVHQPSDTVRVRLRHGRMLIKREIIAGGHVTDVFAEQGQIVEVSRNWAESLLGRTLEAGGDVHGNPVFVRDSPIELVD